MSVRSDGDNYRQSWPLYTEKFTVDVADDFSCILYSRSTEVKKLMKMQRKYIPTTMRTVIDAIGAFLCNVDRNLSRSVPSS